MKFQKSILAVTIFMIVVSLSSILFAKDDNVLRDAGNAISNVAEDAGNSMRNDAENAGNAIRNTAENIGNGVRDAAGSVGNTMENGLNGAVNTMDNDNTNYTATRVNTDNGSVMGMNPVTWSWLILAVAGIIIVALVWRYASQDNHHEE